MGKYTLYFDRCAADFTPIAMSPGTAGIAPPVALTYDSQAGNGLLGMGWQLEGLPSISSNATMPSSKPMSPSAAIARQR